MNIERRTFLKSIAAALAVAASFRLASVLDLGDLEESSTVRHAFLRLTRPDGTSILIDGKESIDGNGWDFGTVPENGVVDRVELVTGDYTHELKIEVARADEALTIRSWGLDELVG